MNKEEREWKRYQEEIQRIWNESPDDLSYLAQPIYLPKIMPEYSDKYMKERKRRIQSLRNIGMDNLANELEEYLVVRK